MTRRSRYKPPVLSEEEWRAAKKVARVVCRANREAIGRHPCFTHLIAAAWFIRETVDMMNAHGLK